LIEKTISYLRSPAIGVAAVFSIGFLAVFIFLIIFRRPLTQIVEQSNCADVARISIGLSGIEIVKQMRHSRRQRNLKRHSRVDAPDKSSGLPP
jgi:hypothetical protein